MKIAANGDCGSKAFVVFVATGAPAAVAVAVVADTVASLTTQAQTLSKA